MALKICAVLFRSVSTTDVGDCEVLAIQFFLFSINFTQIFRICPKMFQFLKYLLHKQIIEMCHSQNLRRPLSVPCPTQCAFQEVQTLNTNSCEIIIMVLFYFDIIVCVKKINFRMANVIDFIYKKITLKK